MKKKIWILIIIIVILIILLFPKKEEYYDGGSVEYKSLIYKLVKYHKVTDELEIEYIKGTKLYIFNINVINTIDEKELNPKILTISSKTNRISMERGTFNYYNSDLDIGKVGDGISLIEREYKETLIAQNNEELILENLNPYNINNIELYFFENKEKVSYEVDYDKEKQTIKTPDIKGEYIIVLDCQSTNVKTTYSFKLEIK